MVAAKTSEMPKPKVKPAAVFAVLIAYFIKEQIIQNNSLFSRLFFRLFN